MPNIPKFEVPYNFNESLILFYKKYASYISFLFLPPYKDDAINTRSSIETKKKGRCYMPQSRDEYEYHLRKIVDAGLHYVVLWQLPDSILSSKTLNYYCSLCVSGFVIGNDENAKIIKDFNPQLLVIGSLIQRLCENISKKDLRYYDYVLLYYPFNRSLDAIKQLSHIKNKVVIMPNTFCHIDCPSIHHWFPSKDRPFVLDRDCLVLKDSLGYTKKCGFIFPEHLCLFDNYIGGYKLQGREYTTSFLKQLCEIYFERKSARDFLFPLLEDDMLYALQEEVQRMSPEKYYNVKTQEIIGVI